MSAASTLMQLLERVDADRLEVMLDSHVLLHLLEECGHDGDELRAKLQAGESPGTLLLLLLEKHDPDALWAMIPAELRQHAKTRITEKSVDPTLAFRSRRWPLVVWFVGAIFPTMWALGCFPEWGSGVTFGGIVFAVIVGGGAGAYTYPDDRVAAGTAAAIAAVVSIFAGALIAPYIGGFFRIGVILALLPGAGLGALVFFGMNRFRRREEPSAF